MYLTYRICHIFYLYRWISIIFRVLDTIDKYISFSLLRYIL